MKLLSVVLVVTETIILLWGSQSFAQEDNENFSVPSVFEYPPVTGRDPFSPLIKPEKESKTESEENKIIPVVTHSKYKLVGIAWYERKGVALISAEGEIWIVEEGMSVDGLKVARINGKEGEVMLVGEDRIIQLNMMEEIQ